MNEFDIHTMLALNFDGGPCLDVMMKFASAIYIWIPLYIFALYMVYRVHGWKYMLFALLFIAAGVGICDQVANLFKSPLTPYLRPTRTEIAPLLHTVGGYTGGLYGTVSGHASTTFCIFLTTSLMVRKQWFTAIMLLYTIIVSYSRIYLGVHFPFQIIFGILLGTIVATGLYFLLSYLAQKYHWSTKPTEETEG